MDHNNYQAEKCESPEGCHYFCVLLSIMSVGRKQLIYTCRWRLETCQIPMLKRSECQMGICNIAHSFDQDKTNMTNVMIMMPVSGQPKSMLLFTVSRTPSLNDDGFVKLAHQDQKQADH